MNERLLLRGLTVATVGLLLIPGCNDDVTMSDDEAGTGTGTETGTDTGTDDDVGTTTTETDTGTDTTTTTETDTDTGTESSTETGTETGTDTGTDTGGTDTGTDTGGTDTGTDTGGTDTGTDTGGTDTGTDTGGTDTGTDTGGTTDTGSTDTGGGFCGDGMIDVDEECDDGNDVDTDDCTNACTDAVCGDAIVWEGMEECDDGNDVDDDACANDCTLTNNDFLIEVSDVMFNGDIPDDGYDGTKASMTCMPLEVVDAGTVQEVTVTVGFDHTWVGDTTAKLISPTGTVVTLHSRPGLAEGADDGTDCCGDSSNATALAPVTYNDAHPTDAELMGDTIAGAELVCQDDLLCDYFTNPGAATPGVLADLAGETVTGTWEICMGDSGGGDAGVLVGGGLSILATP